MGNNVKLEEGIFIKTRPTVLDTDKIGVLQRRYENMEFGEIVFNMECIKVLLTNNTNPQVIDNILESDFDEELMERVSGWFEKLNNAMTDIEN